MNKYIMKKATLFLLAIGFVLSTAAQDTLKLNLNQCVEIATSESPSIKIANMEIERVRYGEKISKGGLLPNVNMGLSYSRALKKQKMFFNIPNMPVDPDGIEVGQDNTFNGATNGISASLPLYAPALWATINISKLDMELALEKSRASKITLINQVSKAFYAVIMAQDSYQVLSRAYQNSLESNRITQNKYKEGVVAEFEAISTSVQLKNIEANLTAAENGVVLAKLQLKMLMGIDMNVPVKIDGKLDDYEATKYADVMQIDTTQLSGNTELKQFDIQERQLQQSLKIQRATYLPTLSASVNYNVMSMVNDEVAFTENHRWFPTSNVALVLQIPLFQGGQRYFKVKQLKVQQRALDQQKKNLERGIQLQIMSQLTNINKSLKLIESNKEAMKQAEKAMIISQKTYEVGVATYLDLRNAELSYMQAGLAYNQSIYDYLIAQTELDKILGQTENKILK